MKPRYRLFRRPWGVYYCEDTQTGKQESLETTHKLEAQRLVHAKNESDQHPAFSLHLARVYFKAGDPEAATRTWGQVMSRIIQTKHGTTRHRWETAVKDKAFDLIRDQIVVETSAESFLRVLERGTVSTNVYLRRLHNWVQDLNWLPWPIIPKNRWPKVRFQDKRAITFKEHDTIATWEPNPERKAFYHLAWHLGASQGDLAALEAENIDWEKRVIAFARRKTGEIALVSFGDEVAAILKKLPQTGPLFPNLRKVRPSDRATEFKQRCRALGISGITLHSYRYAWAQRAKEAGYPERFAQIALGHNSKAVHRAYARKAQVVLPALENFENGPKGKKKAKRGANPNPPPPDAAPSAANAIDPKIIPMPKTG